MLEKEIEKKVCDYAKSKNILSYKVACPANKGMPDRLFISEKGHCFFVEFKSKGKKPTVLQKLKIETLRKHNVSVFLVDNVESGIWIIDGVVKIERITSKDA